METYTFEHVYFELKFLKNYIWRKKELEQLDFVGGWNPYRQSINGVVSTI